MSCLGKYCAAVGGENTTSDVHFNMVLAAQHMHLVVVVNSTTLEVFKESLDVVLKDMI